MTVVDIGPERIREWLQKKISIAEQLAAGELGGDYGDGILILSAIISGIAAELWPGPNIDRKRFVETWARYSSPDLQANLISLPLLVASLKERNDQRTEQARLLRPRYISASGFDSIVVTGDSVDVTEQELLDTTKLSPAEFRPYSYGALFYRHFRSGYAHEYKTTQHAEARIMSTTRDNITYGNWNEGPNRRINFDMTWLGAVARSIVSAAAGDYWDGTRPAPREWWIEGYDDDL